MEIRIQMDWVDPPAGRQSIVAVLARVRADLAAALTEAIRARVIEDDGGAAAVILPDPAHPQAGSRLAGL